MEKIEIYTDGSCRKNPGPGGFGVICFNENKIIQVIKNKILILQLTIEKN